MTLPDCNKDLYKQGVQVFLTHTLSSKDIESFVISVRNDCDKPVDWHYVGGRASILCFENDITTVRKSLLKFRKMHDDAYKTRYQELLGSLDCSNDYIKGIWHYNGFGD